MAFNKELYETVDVSGQGLLKLEPQISMCQIISYEDIENKQYLKIKYDIAEGVFKNFFANQAKQFGEWPNAGYIYRSYKETAMSFFKGFITALEKSNSGYDFKRSGYDFKTINGKKFVGVFGEEEIPYADENGKPIVQVKLQDVRSTEHLVRNDLKIPERKVLSDDDMEKFEKQLYTDKVVAERQASTVADSTPATPTASENDAFYETSKQLASEEDLPF